MCSHRALVEGWLSGLAEHVAITWDPADEWHGESCVITPHNPRALPLAVTFNLPGDGLVLNLGPNIISEQYVSTPGDEEVALEFLRKMIDLAVAGSLVEEQRLLGGRVVRSRMHAPCADGVSDLDLRTYAGLSGLVPFTVRRTVRYEPYAAIRRDG